MKWKNILYFPAGLCFLSLAKIKHMLKGYVSPKPFGLDDIPRCIQYDMQVVDHWLSRLADYTGQPDPLAGQTILELGPGSDMGCGLYLLARGAAAYNALDVNDLALKVPDVFYLRFVDEIGQRFGRGVADEIAGEWKNIQNQDETRRLRYVVRPDFDPVAAFGENTVDIVFSQAAFEHFDDVEATIARVSRTCRKGAWLVAEIDLKTHSRWICDKDPNNIYRYPTGLYRAFYFPGIPNRMRPYQYEDILKRHGWADIQIIPRRCLPEGVPAYDGMAKPFRDAKNRMEELVVVVCARFEGIAD